MNAATTMFAATAADLPHGLHRDVPGAVYHARIPGLVSKSVLDLIARSPAHYAAWLAGHEEPETPALAFGSAFHCALLEPARFGAAYAAEPAFGDCRVKANKERRDAWRAAHAHAKLISTEDENTIRGMVAAVRAHSLAGRMIRDGDPELTVRWRDRETGLECKSRADYYVRKYRMVIDVKTTQDASAEAFRRDVARYRYHVQDALYRAGFAAADAPVEHFVFVAVEKEPPYAVATYSLDAKGVETGYSHVARDMQRLAQCLRANEFPGYPATIQTIELPPWAA